MAVVRSSNAGGEVVETPVRSWNAGREVVERRS
jgi:hypothetical protein